MNSCEIPVCTCRHLQIGETGARPHRSMHVGTLLFISDHHEIIGAKAPTIPWIRPIYFDSSKVSAGCDELFEELVFDEIFADVLVAALLTLLPTAETSLPIPLIVLQPENANIIAARPASKLSFFIFPLRYRSYKHLKFIRYILSCSVNSLTNF